MNNAYEKDKKGGNRIKRGCQKHQVEKIMLKKSHHISTVRYQYTTGRRTSGICDENMNQTVALLCDSVYLICLQIRYGLSVMTTFELLDYALPSRYHSHSYLTS